jgi:hypothetical protein
MPGKIQSPGMTARRQFLCANNDHIPNKEISNSSEVCNPAFFPLLFYFWLQACPNCGIGPNARVSHVRLLFNGLLVPIQRFIKILTNILIDVFTVKANTGYAPMRNDEKT